MPAAVLSSPGSTIAVHLLPQDTYGPPMGKRLLMFVDDLNMPRVDTYGTQQPIALLKMFIERKGFYDRGKELTWKNMKDVQMVAAMGPPGGARNAVDPRFISLFSAFEVQAPTSDNLRTIYQVCCSTHPGCGVRRASKQLSSQHLHAMLGLPWCKLPIPTSWLPCVPVCVSPWLPACRPS